jgi:recombination protein RecA
MRDREPLPRKTFSGRGNPSQAAEVIPSGSLRLDIALRLGGVPRGRICEIYGPISSGKTTICQHIIAEAQSLGEICAFIDVDHTLDVRYAQRCGVDLGRLIVSEPIDAEQALETAYRLTSSKAAGVVVVDSINSLVTEAELTGKIDNPGEPSIDLLVSQTLQRMVPSLEETQTGIETACCHPIKTDHDFPYKD